jgi:hypothetical protein
MGKIVKRFHGLRLRQKHSYLGFGCYPGVYGSVLFLC